MSEPDSDTSNGESYRDDPDHFGKASTTAQGGVSGDYTGQGVGGDASFGQDRGVAARSGPAAWDWSSPPQASAQGGDAASAGEDGKDEAVTSRSAAPGQSSYGGFKNEGTSEQNRGDDSDASKGGTSSPTGSQPPGGAASDALSPGASSDEAPPRDASKGAAK